MAAEAREKNKQILTIPNLLSAFRILLVPVFVWLYCGKRDYPLAAWALVLSGVTDIADGFIARQFRMVSELGKALDPIADKLTQTAALACLLTRFPPMWWLLGLLVVKETVMAVMGLLVIRRTGGTYSAAWHGKLAACVLYAVIFVHIVWYGIPAAVSHSLATAGAASILLSLTLYTARNLRRIRGAEQSLRKEEMESTILDFDCVGIDNGGVIPISHTGRGQDLSPEFLIWNLSPKAQTLAITLEDLTHPIRGFTHWIIWNIPAAHRIKSGIPAGKIVPSLGNARQGIAYGRHRYAGPKPPRRDTHWYRFTVYALDCRLELSPRARKKDFLQAAEKHVIQMGCIECAFE